ncbi:MAG: hypothetical protein V4739_02090 [Pseudomonadota bacterium]
MYLLIIAWVYVVLMMAISEATSTQGTVLGALFTFLLYGALPLGIVLYLMRTPARRARRKRLAAEATAAAADVSGQAPNGSSHAPGDTVPSKGKEL